MLNIYCTRIHTQTHHTHSYKYTPSSISLANIIQEEHIMKSVPLHSFLLSAFSVSGWRYVFPLFFFLPLSQTLTYIRAYNMPTHIRTSPSLSFCWTLDSGPLRLRRCSGFAFGHLQLRETTHNSYQVSTTHTILPPHTHVSLTSKTSFTRKNILSGSFSLSFKKKPAHETTAPEQCKSQLNTTQILN